MTARYQTAIHWFRRDLRITDNTSLHHAVRRSREVVPVYLLSDWKKKHNWTGPGRQRFLCGCLESLSENLDAIGGRLVIRQGDAVAELEKLIKETRAEAVFFNRDPDPFGRETEKRIAELCRQFGIDCHSFKDAVLHEPGEVLTTTGDPYRVYTPYANRWFEQSKPALVPRPTEIRTPESLSSLPPPALETWKLKMPKELDLPPAGEKAARDRLRKALRGPVLEYADKRDLPAEDATTHLGPDLRFGALSIREVFHKARHAADSAGTAEQRESAHTFLKQLAWREFFMAILGHFPNVLDEEFAPKWRGLPWDKPSRQKKFDRWKQGRTGFPLVDAGMRQLLATGYMHNRVRMITAMFLTKDLHLDWRLGEAHFMRHLIDGEIANNNGGWQWSAGTGADAAPYFRIQNPWTQTEKYDPEGEYIRRWVPELAGADPKLFRKPPPDSKPIADGYPLPIVDHQEEREKTLEIFKKHGGE